jgi:hypothetical protein
MGRALRGLLRELGMGMDQVDPLRSWSDPKVQDQWVMWVGLQ